MSEVRNWATSSPVAGDTCPWEGSRTEPLSQGTTVPPGQPPPHRLAAKEMSAETSDSEHPPAEPPRGGPAQGDVRGTVCVHRPGVTTQRSRARPQPG